MADEALIDKVHDLTDLELAVLLCLISREHCLISTPATACDHLVQELQLIAIKTFGLEPVLIDCTPSTTLDDFASSLLSSTSPSPVSPATADVDDDHGSRKSDSFSNDAASRDSYFALPSRNQHPTLQLPPHLTRGITAASPTTTTTTTTSAASPAIANVIIVRNLDRAPHPIQIQALELLRTRRLFTRTTMQVAPKQFVFVPVLEAASGGQARVTRHLNDFLAMAHWHDPVHGFANLEERGGEAAGEPRWCAQDDDAASTGSIVKRAYVDRHAATRALISEDDITCLRELGQKVDVDVDVLRYQMNIVSFLRMHRAVDSGVTPSATKHLGQLMRNLAPLHRLDLVTPALVGLAARKVYLHRIRITHPAKERSMQWGSELQAVEALLRDVGPEQVLDEVMSMVTAPV